MGEIFSRELPPEPLEFTGERMTSDARGQIEYEHLHRYFFARELVRGRRVLDVASGEGYGSAILAQTASDVIGIEIASDAVWHAASCYRKPNLRFVQADGRSLPIKSGSIDAVVSFETLEHLFEQRLFLSEIRQVLSPGGVLIMSSPDRDIYSPTNGGANEFHVKELTEKEFTRLTGEYFAHSQLFRQRAFVGSALIGDERSQNGPHWMTFESRGTGHFEASSGLSRAPYLIAVASDDAKALGFDTLFIHANDVNAGLRDAKATDAARGETADALMLRAQLAAQADELARLRDEARQLRRQIATQRDERGEADDPPNVAIDPGDPRTLLIAGADEPIEFPLREHAPGTGWYGAEATGDAHHRWTGPEPRFTVELYLPTRPYVGTIKMKPNSLEGFSSLSISNGAQQLPYNYSSNQDGSIILLFEVPTAESSGHQPLGVITFQHAAVSSPVERGGTDARLLGFCVGSVSFAPGRLAPIDGTSAVKSPE